MNGRVFPDELITADFINNICDVANGHCEYLGGTAIQNPRGQRTYVSQQTPFSRKQQVVGGGWNPWLWTPTIVQLSVENTEDQVYSVLSVDNCAIMLGRAPYDFGSLSATNGEVLSGYVFAVIQHPVWGTNYYDVSAVLSSASSFDGMEQIHNDFSVLPLYYVDKDTGMTKDFRGIPTATMYA